MSEAPAEDGAERSASAPARSARLLAVASAALLSAAAILGLSVVCREVPGSGAAPELGGSLPGCRPEPACAGGGPAPVVLPLPASRR